MTPEEKRLRHNESAKRWREANKDKANEAARRWRAKNPEKQKEATRRWTQAHAEELTAKNAEAWAMNKVQLSKQFKEWHTEAMKDPAYRKRKSQVAMQWAKDNPEKYKAIQQRRKAKKRGAVGSHTLADWQMILDGFDHKCAYCQTANVPLEREHMLPISRGGSDAWYNIVPACGPCNRRKATKSVQQFLEEMT